MWSDVAYVVQNVRSFEGLNVEGRISSLGGMRKFSWTWTRFLILIPILTLIPTLIPKITTFGAPMQRSYGTEAVDPYSGL